MSNPTSSSAAVVADTIVRTVELGVTITDPSWVICLSALSFRLPVHPEWS